MRLFIWHYTGTLVACNLKYRDFAKNVSCQSLIPNFAFGVIAGTLLDGKIFFIRGAIKSEIIESENVTIQPSRCFKEKSKRF